MRDIDPLYVSNAKVVFCMRMYTDVLLTLNKIKNTYCFLYPYYNLLDPFL